MKKMLLMFLFLALAQTAAAQDWARARLEKSPRHREWATLKHDGRALETFIVTRRRKTSAQWCW